MSAPTKNNDFRNLLLSWPEKAIAYLYEHYYDHFLRIADMHTHDRNMSEDAIQEVFIDIAQRHRELGQPSDQHIQTYLIRAVTNHSITLYKKGLRSNIRDTQYFYDNESARAEKSADTGLMASEKRSFLRIVIGTLPPREKECLLMQMDEHLRAREIARRLGLSVKTVEGYLSSAHNRIRKYGANLK